MPHVIGSVRERGVLLYRIRPDFPASWASHLDAADAALLDGTDVTGVVSVGQYPAIRGPDLAEAFGARLGRDVVFDQITAEELRTSMAPLIGEQGCSGAVPLQPVLEPLEREAARGVPYDRLAVQRCRVR
ncbi:hypothetical protein [Streptomyces sp. SID12501]|uniref:hypothetical protein n=1 Tax=Streptomyces sp. SID12501 TaxID=2706042 RepID=UPI001941D7CB|nr:hypothetical protein [Streptomyces sp. SID12501]